MHCHPRVPLPGQGASSWVVGGGIGLQIWRLAANKLNKQSRIADLDIWRLAKTSDCNTYLFKNIKLGLGTRLIMWLLEFSRII